jgi:hypothetical protein
MIFPRYHQLTSVRQILTHAKETVSDKNTKSNIQQVQANQNPSLACHQLHGLFDNTGETTSLILSLS